MSSTADELDKIADAREQQGTLSPIAELVDRHAERRESEIVKRLIMFFKQGRLDGTTAIAGIGQIAALRELVADLERDRDRTTAQLSQAVL